MPLLQEWSPLPNSLAAIWIIEEPESFFSEKNGVDATHIRHPKRRLEHLAGRFLLQQLNTDFPLHLIEKDQQGKPVLPGNECFFSVSHSYPYVTAIVSNHHAVGIDIQVPHPNIAALAAKFLDEDERRRLGQSDAHFNLAWTAKEAAYKLQGLRGVDFKRHLPILEFEEEVMTCRMRIKCMLLPGCDPATVISMKNSSYNYSIAFFKTS